MVFFCGNTFFCFALLCESRGAVCVFAVLFATDQQVKNEKQMVFFVETRFFVLLCESRGAVCVFAVLFATDQQLCVERCAACAIRFVVVCVKRIKKILFLFFLTRVCVARAAHSHSQQIEFIVMGGTFMSLPVDYRDYFIRNLHDALSGHASNSVDEAVMFSEHSRHKCIGITIETRPDYCLAPHLSSMLSYGCTRLEVGVQSVYEDVARDTNRCGSVCVVSVCIRVTVCLCMCVCSLSLSLSDSL